MNERIKELYLQARTAAWNEPIDLRNCSVEDIKGISQQVYEKFAELIVRECAKSLWTEECHNSDLALEEFERNSAKIKQHFGVEE
jgi:hypothetical protein